MKTNALIFDFDDTLIITHLRHYQIIVDFFKIHNIPIVFSFKEYLSVRKEFGFSNAELLKKYYNEEKFESKFKTYFLKNIESQSYLSLDKKIVDYELIKNASTKTDLYLLSLRSNHTNAMNQIKTYNFYSLFKNIFFLSHNKVNPKVDVLLNLKTQYKKIIFIGDSLLDKTAADDAGVEFILVKTGFYDLNHQHQYKNINSYLETI